jgi:two-component system response regulator HydG
VPAGGGLRESVKKISQEAEKKLITEALSMSGGKKNVAARLLDVDEKTLYNKMKEYEIDSKILGGGRSN